MKNKEKNSVMQNITNEIIMNSVDAANREYFDWNNGWRRLRYCSAYVAETENYYLLCSYYTVVAVIDKRTHVLFDALRLVYGYTATSAQHISKFAHDYGAERIARGYPV